MLSRTTGIAACTALIAALLALFATLAGTSTGSERRAAATGLLRVDGKLKPSTSMYTEGGFEYVTIRLSATRALILKHRYQLGKIKLTRRLPAGSYRLASWTQTCSGNCSHLDPPAYECGRTLRIKPSGSVRATVLSEVGKHCRISVR
jgi:hypothetical protein